VVDRLGKGLRFQDFSVGKALVAFWSGASQKKVIFPFF
jgi:hypothetical protein